MKIIALVKQVPDTWGDRVLDTETGFLDRGASDAIIDEINERALEVALQYKDGNKDAEVIALGVGPKGATDTLRKALAMGADSAVHVLDDGIAGADLAFTAEVIAAAAQRTGFDVIIAGNESTDGRGGAIPAMIAEKLGLPQLTYLDTVELTGDSVSGVRATEYGTLDVSSALPAVVSVTERAAEPRFPNFKGIMSAKKKPLDTVSLADLGVEAPAAKSVVTSVAQRPERSAGTKITDDGTAAEQLAEFLATNRLI